MNAAKTTAVVLALTFAGGTAAQACNGYVTTTNHTNELQQVVQWYTQKLGTTDKYVLNHSNVPTVAPGDSLRTKIVTLRKKNTMFRLAASTNSGRTHYTNYAKCADGWTLNIY